MVELRITAKRQITLGRDLLEHLGVGTGDRVVVSLLPDGRIEIQAAQKSDISCIFGMLSGKSTKTLSIGEIKTLTERGWAARGERGRRD